MSFLNSAFPSVSNSSEFDLIMYNRIVDGITDMTAILAGICDQAGNLSLAAAKAIEWGSVSKITWSAAKVQVDRLEIASPWTFGTLGPTGDCTVSNDAGLTNIGTNLTLSGNLVVTGVIRVPTITDTSFTIAQIAEPDDPPDDEAVFWCSNGTGIGDVGDIMLKIQSGAVVKSKTLVDFV